MRILILFFFIIFLNAEEISNYYIKVNVLNDGKLNIQENILYDFSPNQRHGIYRNIPLNNNSVDLKSIYQDNAPANYEIIYSNNDIVFKIGDPDRLLTSKHLYKIEYSIDRAVFKKDNNFNAISLNVIGTGWKVDINNIDIDIFLPPKLATAKFKVFIGNRGSNEEYKFIKISSTHYKIIKKHLKPHQGITFDLYFDKNLINVKTLSIIWEIIFVILFSLGIYFYYSKHKIPYIAISAQYYPPKDLDVLKVGLLIDQIADSQDFSSAILDLATKGYLKIKTEQKEVLGVFNKKIIILEKLKEDDGLDFDEKKLFNTLFYEKREFVLGQKDVTIATRLRNMISLVNEWLYEWSLKEGYMKENPKKAKASFLLKSSIPIIIALAFALKEMISFYGSMAIIGVVSAVFSIIAIIIFFQKGIISKIFGIIFLGVSLIILFSSGINIINPFSIVMLSVIPLFVFSNKISSYSIKGINRLKYLLGLKEFILKVEKDKLEFLLKENPNYLDEMLPYAVLFGAKHWFDFYDEFNIESNWYIGEKTYFYGLDEDIISSFEDSANYTESNNSDSFSGGGSVGGGSGGGGGGSW